MNRALIFALVLIAFAGGVEATPRMNFDPDYPHATDAPAWAVKVMMRQGGISGQMPVDPSDPMWQHGQCDAPSPQSLRADHSFRRDFHNVGSNRRSQGCRV
jgi:hypothetical protein